MLNYAVNSRVEHRVIDRETTTALIERRDYVLKLGRRDTIQRVLERRDFLLNILLTCCLLQNY